MDKFNFDPYLNISTKLKSRRHKIVFCLLKHGQNFGELKNDFRKKESHTLLVYSSFSEAN